MTNGKDSGRETGTRRVSNVEKHAFGPSRPTEKLPLNEGLGVSKPEPRPRPKPKPKGK